MNQTEINIAAGAAGTLVGTAFVLYNTREARLRRKAKKIFKKLRAAGYSNDVIYEAARRERNLEMMAEVLNH